MYTIKQNESLGYDIVADENTDHERVVWQEVNLHNALVQLIDRQRSEAEYLAKKAREKQIMEIAISWSAIQVSIEAENRGLNSDFSVEEETAIRLEMAEVALQKKESKLPQKRPLRK